MGGPARTARKPRRQRGGHRGRTDDRPASRTRGPDREHPMTNLTADRARALLGGTGKLNGHDILNGHDVLAGHASRRGTLLITQPRHFWPRLFGGQGQRATREKRPGASLIGAGGVLLFLLGSGLLAVSFAAQYQYVLHERHQHIASLIEAGALDVGLIIFSLLALGLARGGLSAKVERPAVLAAAARSAVT